MEMGDHFVWISALFGFRTFGFWHSTVSYNSPYLETITKATRAKPDHV